VDVNTPYHQDRVPQSPVNRLLHQADVERRATKATPQETMTAKKRAIETWP
jgi:hypothetical protein